MPFVTDIEGRSWSEFCCVGDPTAVYTKNTPGDDGTTWSHNTIEMVQI
jgi:hypothetical protein